MSAVTNIAAYKFASLTDLKPLRDRLLAACKAWGLKGTILLSTEGINLFVAGPGKEVDELVATLQSIPGLEDLTPKRSESGHQPFTRMMVRIKKEIIAFGVAGIDPARRTSPKLSAATLKQWLDEGRPVTLLDTRNDYEVKLGTFRGAQTLDISHFRQFPDAVKALPEGMKDQAIVMFCTGGIRCEKAGPFMEKEGFQSIFQLDGGILKYFEECGGDHYEGECFVFDQRVGVDPALQETDSAQCFVCQASLHEADQNDPRYEQGRSCSYCYKTSSELMAQTILEREEALRKAATPLPGSSPYENRRPMRVPAVFAGRSVIEFLSEVFDHAPQGDWLQLCAEGRIEGEDGVVLSAESPLKGGERIVHVVPMTIEPDVNPDVRILHEDEAIIVLNKPAPLPMHPCGRFNKNTLQFFLHAAYAPLKPRPAHRLDANTSGLVVCTKTRRFAGLLQPQFAEGNVKKTYLTMVSGHPEKDDFVCDLPLSSRPAELGYRAIDLEDGLPAYTEFRVIERRGNGTSLLEASPLTGRTNQIRVHLWQMGYPICGDPAYLQGGQLGEGMTLRPSDPPMALHAWKLEFRHPVSREFVKFEAVAPGWGQIQS